VSQHPTPLQAALANQKLRLAGDAAGVTPRELAAVINCLPPGRYRMANVVDRRTPSAEHLTDKGTDALLARAAAVRDTADISPQTKQALRRSRAYIHAANAADKLCAEFVARATAAADRCGDMHPGLKAQAVFQALLDCFPTLAVRDAITGAYSTGCDDYGEFRKDLDRELDRKYPRALGDPRDTPLVSVGPSGIGGYAQREIAPPVAKCTCLFCGAPTLGRDECGDCERARHNDDDAQRAAQAREDAEGGGAHAR
jgi:hypothetical protein